MNPINPLGAAVAVVVVVVVGLTVAAGPQLGTTRPTGAPDAAQTYEHLANAIIAIRETETSLVRDLMTGAFIDAQALLDAAADASGAERRARLEGAAKAVTEIATEGDKRVQAVRQRLLRAGHHHHTDAETEADYIFVDGREKNELLGLAGRIARMGPKASRRDVLTLSAELQGLFTRAMAPE